MENNYQYSTEDLQARDRAHVIHSFSDLSALKEDNCTVMTGSDGIYVKDSDGNQFIDGIGGLWCVNIGYGREEMIEAIADQLRQIPFYSSFTNLTNAPSVELASKIASLAPGNLNRMFFGTGGSMANDTAVRIAHHYFNRIGKPEKKHIISRQHAYHGSTYMAMSMTGPIYHTGWDVENNIVHHVSAPYSYRRPDGMSMSEFCDSLIAELEAKIVDLGAENVAAFIAEPLMGAGGVIVPPPGYQRRTWDVCQKYGVLYISDEVVTAFARLGHMFASKDMFDVQPDILVCAKGISSGYQPLSATLISDDIYEAISAPGGAFYHGFTYSGHPAACAAGLKNIEIMEREDICGRVKKTGPYFEKMLNGLCDLDIVGEVRGSHFMMCIENVANKDTKELLPMEADVGKRVHKHCQARGLIVRPLGHLNILSPTLILEESDIDQMGEILRASIKATMDDLSKEGVL
ncbi:MAG: aminotransferase [Rhodospirillales bacterium]|jgi:putrescine---pyruvate transaminase|nr:aminotransferase [Rhodospirillales bacterium]